MNTQIVFDGKAEAVRIENELRESGKLQNKTLVIFQCDGATEESVYVRLKRVMGERLGVKVRVSILQDKEYLKQELRMANEDSEVDGILVQLPIVNTQKEEVESILRMINPEKDIDGLNPKSRFVPAVVMAVESILEKINLGHDESIAVVGAYGMVGSRLMRRLIDLGFVVSGFDVPDDLMKLKDFDVIISATGKQDLITSDMVRDGFVGIDLGYPRGDISIEASKKASVITPVPGGAGPITIVSLFVSLASVY